MSCMLGGLKFERDRLAGSAGNCPVHSEIAAVRRLPFVVLFGEDLADEREDAVVVEEHAADVGAPLELPCSLA